MVQGINGTLAVETPANPACFSRAKLGHAKMETRSGGRAAIDSSKPADIVILKCSGSEHFSVLPGASLMFLNLGCDLYF